MGDCSLDNNITIGKITDKGVSPIPLLLLKKALPLRATKEVGIVVLRGCDISKPRGHRTWAYVVCMCYSAPTTLRCLSYQIDLKSERGIDLPSLLFFFLVNEVLGPVRVLGCVGYDTVRAPQTLPCPAHLDNLSCPVNTLAPRGKRSHTSVKFDTSAFASTILLFDSHSLFISRHVSQGPHPRVLRGGRGGGIRSRKGARSISQVTKTRARIR